MVRRLPLDWRMLGLNMDGQCDGERRTGRLFRRIRPAHVLLMCKSNE